MRWQAIDHYFMECAILQLQIFGITARESDCPLATVAGPPTVRGQFKVLPHGGWICFKAGRQSDSPTVREHTHCSLHMGV